MPSLLINKYFLVVSTLWLVITIAIIWFFFPSAIKQFNDIRISEHLLAEQIKTSQADAAGVRDLVAE